MQPGYPVRWTTSSTWARSLNPFVINLWSWGPFRKRCKRINSVLKNSGSGMKMVLKAFSLGLSQGTTLLQSRRISPRKLRRYEGLLNPSPNPSITVSLLWPPRQHLVLRIQAPHENTLVFRQNSTWSWSNRDQALNSPSIQWQLTVQYGQTLILSV